MRIPRTLDDITPEWLTSALRGSGSLEDARVESVDAGNIGEGRGFACIIARLTVRYDRPVADGPQTVIAKVSSPHAGATLNVDVPGGRALGDAILERLAAPADWECGDLIPD